MSENTNSNCKRAFAKPRDVLYAIENEARNNRKLLRKREKSLDKRAWRETGDAIKLARTIEAIARRAANLSAADATTSVELLELMLVLLSEKMALILAS